MRQLLGVNPMTGTHHYVDYDENEDVLYFTEEQDITALLELNRKMYNEAPDRWGDGASAARLPLSLRMQLQRQGITEDEKLWKKWLNDPDNRAFRIRPGRI